YDLEGPHAASSMFPLHLAESISRNCVETEQKRRGAGNGGNQGTSLRQGRNPVRFSPHLDADHGGGCGGNRGCLDGAAASLRHRLPGGGRTLRGREHRGGGKYVRTRRRLARHSRRG